MLNEQELKSVRHFAQTEISKLGIELNDEQIKKMGQFIGLLQKWGRVHNLTALHELSDILEKHMLDSLSVAHLLKGDRICDVGTGAGFPGIPLSIIETDKQFDLLDSNQKKTLFLQQVVRELSLKHVGVMHQRVEKYTPEVPYHTVISRAFAPLDRMLDLLGHLIAEEGCLLAMKGDKAHEEIALLPEHFELLEVAPITFDARIGTRYCLMIQKKKGV